MKTTVLTFNEIIEALKPFKWSLKLVDDIKYWTTSYEEWFKIILEDTIDKKKYIKERFDCDDFAKVFKCHCIEKYGLNAVGLVRDFLGRHAYNVIVDDTATAFIYEPQNDTFIKADKFKDKYHTRKLCLITF